MYSRFTVYTPHEFSPMRQKFWCPFLEFSLGVQGGNMQPCSCNWIVFSQLFGKLKDSRQVGCLEEFGRVPGE